MTREIKKKLLWCELYVWRIPPPQKGTIHIDTHKEKKNHTLEVTRHGDGSLDSHPVSVQMAEGSERSCTEKKGTIRQIQKKTKGGFGETPGKLLTLK